MEFNEKLQELRKQKGYTQDELAQLLYVSRAAVSKWESGRGYPNIESLKSIAKLFGTTVDELLSSDEILDLAQKNGDEKEKRFQALIFGLLDICMSLLLFLPLFAARQEKLVYSTSLLSLQGVAIYLKVFYFLCIISTTVLGILILALQDTKLIAWEKSKKKISLTLSAVSVLLFAISLQPYAVVFSFVLLAIKTLTLIK